jgi:poly-gamma-glutamate synthase PgsB/CapB
MAREQIWCESTRAARELRRSLGEKVAMLGRAETGKVPGPALGEYVDDTVGRVLSVLAQEDFGYDLERGPRSARITRGHVFGFRLWRFLHELRNSSPDKRQAFPHTIGRIFRGDVRAPSAILSELAETRVPGEPLFIAEEGGWRPYLPLLDEVISCLTRGWKAEPVKIYTSEGVTELAPPASFALRLKAYSRITKDFAGIAKLRNWKSTLQESPSSYLRELKDLGFTIRFRPHPTGAEPPVADPGVTRFFPAVFPIQAQDLWNRMKEYFVSVYDNSLFELALFTGIACGLFAARHIHANASVRKWRRRLPLVVGGWGTRGKSGTERLKAALFNALGHGVVSKTTGCEAMFLYAHPFGQTREMFLFRSYDKATIWEQRNVIRMADKLEAEVFLWECMALTPSYVEVLQHHWVQDDISTITNTYPDHEDLQGPAGINIPDVIGIFTPHDAKTVTTEEQMLPILAEKAKSLRTSLRRVSWIEQGTIAPDVLKRFPYDEHPSNIALVLGLAEDLGIDRDFALKEMADRVVPDLGVLKTSPIARVRTRRLQFSNGCSANERHGTLSNWIRCGFNVQDPVAEPGVWITTVVNNRADRVPRSRVFARILVEDISADRHFLIGGNLNGLVGYVRQAWESYAPTISLWPKDSKDAPASVLRDMTLRYRLPVERAQVAAKFKAMLAGRDLPPGFEEEANAVLESVQPLKEKLEAAGVKDHVDAILRHHGAHLECLDEYEALRARVEKAVPDDQGTLDQAFRDFLWKWFQRKLVVVHDYYTTGEQLVNLIAEETPPGCLNRVMGIQNIKGTGLDFVYRWQAWDACYRACQLLLENDPAQAEKGLRALASFHEYGVLSEEHVKDVLAQVRQSPVAQTEHFQAEMAVVKSNFDHAMEELHQKLGAVRKEAGWLEKLIAALEGFLDAGDAVRRRKLANQIYRDLVVERISTDRAVLELQNLNKRQKGGWLLQKVLSARSFAARMATLVLTRARKG